MVHFVGAGCGAADLITIRGKNLLEKADVIIYAGSLINKELLSYAKDGCETYDSAYMTMEEVLEVVKAAEKEKKMTVRLHSGDSSIYGAIKEQMKEMDELNIAYDVCPGVSSLNGAASSLKAEYTLPGVSQSVIITPMEGRTKMPEKEKLHMLAAHNATMVIFLSSGLGESVQQELLQGGYRPDTPCAIVYKATWPEEQIYRCTVSTIAQTLEDNNISRTALITVGDFLGEDFLRSELYNPAFSTDYRQATK